MQSFLHSYSIATYPATHISVPFRQTTSYNRDRHVSVVVRITKQKRISCSPECLHHVRLSRDANIEYRKEMIVLPCSTVPDVEGNDAIH